MESLMKTKTMSSREIAELANKRHKDVLEAIRNMEPAWEKVTGRKFPLSEYKDSTGRILPMYTLNKRECLYIATKFNDEAQAKLIVRWEELESKKTIGSLEKKREKRLIFFMKTKRIL
jgi:phage regulator Rha-like protein